MDDLIEIKINSKIYKAKKGSLLIDLLIKENLRVPYFCYHEALGAVGNCRMCMVEIEGQKRPQIACDTFIKEDMSVNTDSKNIVKIRTDILELELINHPVDCPTCDQAGECSLQDFYMDYGLHETKIAVNDKIKHSKHIDLGSNVMLDQKKCVLCARCTRFTDNITKTQELAIINRGDGAKISTMPNNKLKNPYAMNLVDLCPVGALTSKDFRFSQRVWFLSSTPSICQGCAKGCNIFIDHNKIKYQDDKIYRFRPRRNDKINGFFMCDEGRLSYKSLQENRTQNLKNEKMHLDKFNDLIKKYKNNINIIIDANLFNEEIEEILTFSKSIDAKVFSPLEIYIDHNFSDDMLKSSKKASNYQAIKNFKIDTKAPIKNNLIINFNHPQNFSSQDTINFFTHNPKNVDSSLIFPIAVFSENTGHLTNEDNITQLSLKAMQKNNQTPTIIEWLQKLQEHKQ